MGKFNKIQSTFNRGEIGPKGLARVKTEDYFSGCTQLKNFNILPNGGAIKRAGSEYLIDPSAIELNGHDHDFSGCAMLPFVTIRESVQAGVKYDNFTLLIKPEQTSAFDAPLNHLVLLEDNKANGVITRTVVATVGVAGAIFDTGLTSEEIYPEGWDYVQYGTGLIITHKSGKIEPFVVARHPTSPDASFDAYRLDRYAVKGLTSNKYMSQAYPFLDTNITSNKMVCDGTVVEYQNSFGSSKDFPVASGYLRMNIAGVSSVVRLTTAASSSEMYYDDLGAGPNLTSGDSTTDWTVSAWAAGNYPKSVTIYEERLVFGGTTDEPDKVWGSRLGNVFHFAKERLDQDALPAASDISGLNYWGKINPEDPWEFVLASQESNAITWLTATRVLNGGTTGAEFIASGGDAVLSAESQSFSPQTNYGGALARPTRMNNEVIYIQKGQHSLRNFQYSSNNGSNTSLDLSILAEHFHKIGGDNLGFKKITVQTTKSIIWAINNNNYLSGFTYSREYDITAWFRLEIAGTDVAVIDVVALPNTLGDGEDLYISLSRTVNYTTEYFIERIKIDFDSDDISNTTDLDSYKPVFTDSSVIETLAVNATTMSGLGHLEGEDVVLTSNGAVVGTYTVASGSITFAEQPSGNRLIAGLLYEAILDTVDLEGGGDFGTSQGLTQRIDRATIKFYRTLDAKVGSPNFPTRLETVSFPTLEDWVDKRVNLSTGPGMDQRIRVSSSEPLPCIILGITARGVTYD